MRPAPLSVLVFAETGRHWTARALEHDIAVQGRSIETAVDALVKIVRAHVALDLRHKREPLSGFPSAPRLYWNAFHAATQRAPARELDLGDAEGAPRIVVATTDHNPAAYRHVSVSLSA